MFAHRRVEYTRCEEGDRLTAARRGDQAWIDGRKWETGRWLEAAADALAALERMAITPEQRKLMVVQNAHSAAVPMVANKPHASNRRFLEQ